MSLFPQRNTRPIQAFLKASTLSITPLPTTLLMYRRIASVHQPSRHPHTLSKSLHTTSPVKAQNHCLVGGYIILRKTSSLFYRLNHLWAQIIQLCCLICERINLHQQIKVHGKVLLLTPAILHMSFVGAKADDITTAGTNVENNSENVSSV